MDPDFIPTPELHTFIITPIVLKCIQAPRGVAQLVEQRSPKPRVVGSSPATPAKIMTFTKLFEIIPFFFLSLLFVSSVGNLKLSA